MFDQIVVFGDGDRDVVGVYFLEGVGVDYRGGNLISDVNQRDGVQSRIGNGGYQVSRIRFVIGYIDRRFIVGARYFLSDKVRVLFMTGQNMADLRVLV